MSTGTNRSRNDGFSTTRLYGSAIAPVSGGYSMWMWTAEGTAAAWLMLLLGLDVVGHGVVLLTEFTANLGGARGPLMIRYAVLVLANQACMGSMAGGRTGNGMMGEGMSSVGPTWDPRMVALAIVMLASGVIMTTRHDMN